MRSASGDFTIYSAPKSSTTWIYQQNATGTSAGSYLDSQFKVHGFTLVDGDFTAVNYAGAANTWVFGVNHVGSLTGSYGGAGSVKGFLFVNGQYTNIVYPKGAVTNPMAVNDNNAIVGSSHDRRDELRLSLAERQVHVHQFSEVKIWNRFDRHQQCRSDRRQSPLRR